MQLNLFLFGEINCSIVMGLSSLSDKIFHGLSLLARFKS